MIPGIKLTLGGRDYVVPPISIGALELLAERIQAFSGTLADVVNAGNLVDVMEAVMYVGSLKRRRLLHSARRDLKKSRMNLLPASDAPKHPKIGPPRKKVEASCPDASQHRRTR